MDFWTWFWRYDYAPGCPTDTWTVCVNNGNHFIEIFMLLILAIITFLYIGLYPEDE